MKKFVFITLSVFQFFVGFTATVSGFLMVLYPSGVLFQMPPEMLKNSPFNDFFIPGLFLLLVLGVGQLLAGILTMRRHPFAGLVGAAFGIALIIWIFVQVNMIGGRHILQYSYFSIGVFETTLSFLIHGYLSAMNSTVTTSNGG